MKRIVLISLLVMLLANLALAGDNVWTFCGPCNMSISSIAVDPNSPDTLYATGHKGDGDGAYRSFDGGKSWEPMGDLPVGVTISTVAVDPSTRGTLYVGVGLTTGPHIYKSTDCGESWSPADSGLGMSGVATLSIDPITSSIIYATGSSVFKSTNGAESWQFTGQGIENYWTLSLVLDPISPEILYVCSQALEPYYGEIYKSIDGAESWELAINGIQGDIAALSNLVLNPKHPNVLYINVLTDSTILYKTTDGAESWVETSYKQPIICLSIDPKHPDTLFGGGYYGIYRSTDGGQNWQDFSNGLPENIEIFTLTVAPTTPVKIYAGTAYRGVWCYTDTLSGVEDNPSPDHLPRQPSLAQNYPNPFNSNTAISYQLSGVRPHHTTLKVYNILGQEVKTLVDEKQKTGYYKVCWDGRDRSGNLVGSGIYFYRIKAGDYTKTRKMVLIR